MKLTDTEREIFAKGLERIKEITKFDSEIYQIARILHHGIILGEFEEQKEEK